jgi:hypothetical protein
MTGVRLYGEGSHSVLERASMSMLRLVRDHLVVRPDQPLRPDTAGPPGPRPRGWQPPPEGARGSGWGWCGGWGSLARARMAIVTATTTACHDTAQAALRRDTREGSAVRRPGSGASRGWLKPAILLYRLHVRAECPVMSDPDSAKLDPSRPCRHRPANQNRARPAGSSDRSAAQSSIRAAQERGAHPLRSHLVIIGVAGQFCRPDHGYRELMAAGAVAWQREGAGNAWNRCGRRWLT